jgi:predicted Zn-dependent peptidase
MNQTLGGTFTARVNMNLREDKGWAYGAYTFLQEAKGQRPFMVYAPVQTDKTGPALKELVKELNAYSAEKPPTQEELTRATQDSVRSLPGQFETSGAVMGSLLSSTRFDRPLNYPTTLPQKYQALSVDDLKAAAAEVVHPEKLVWVIIGDAQKIEAEVKDALGLEVSIRSMADL